MGRSKWLLLLLIPMLFGFDTRNPFRTRGPFKAADFTIGGGSSTWTGTFGPCTSGVDCFCDRAQGTGPLGTSDPVYNTDIFFCEDFDHDAFYEQNPTHGGTYGNGNWVAADGSCTWGSIDRGCASHWYKKFSQGEPSTSWKNGEPTETPTVGSRCTLGGPQCSGAIAWHPTNLWNGNNYRSQVYIVRPDGYDDEVSTLASPQIPGSGGETILGNAALAHRIAAGSTGGTSGRVDIGQTRSQLGTTAATQYSSNIFSQPILNYAWKHDEYAGSRSYNGNWDSAFFGFRQSNSNIDTFPVNLTLNLFYTADACARASAAVVRKGEVACVGNSFMVWRPKLSETTYRFTSTFGTNYHCFQTYYDWRDISAVVTKAWMDGELLVDITTDWSNTTYDEASGTDGVRMHFFDYYSNGNDQTSNKTTETVYRYLDNFVMRDGTPVSCSDIGFININD